MSAVWIAVIAISLLGLIFGLILGYASRHFAVQD
ncbi:electron transport complex subunit RsxB, partial [Klebsiella pneumoniae]